MKKFEVKGHEPSYLPEGEWKLVWAGKPVDVLTKAELPDEFVVDYVRVFDRVR